MGTRGGCGYHWKYVVKALTFSVIILEAYKETFRLFVLVLTTIIVVYSKPRSSSKRSLFGL